MCRVFPEFIALRLSLSGPFLKVILSGGKSDLTAPVRSTGDCLSPIPAGMNKSD